MFALQVTHVDGRVETIGQISHPDRAPAFAVCVPRLTDWSVAYRARTAGDASDWCKARSLDPRRVHIARIRVVAPVAPAKRCAACGAVEPVDRSCGCFDNGCQ